MRQALFILLTRKFGTPQTGDRGWVEPAPKNTAAYLCSCLPQVFFFLHFFFCDQRKPLKAVLTKMDLCPTCQQFDISSFSRTPYRCITYPFKPIQTAAQGGCSFCGLIVSCLGDGIQPPAGDETELWVHLQCRTRGGDITKPLKARRMYASLSSSPTPDITIESYELKSCTFHLAADSGEYFSNGLMLLSGISGFGLNCFNRHSSGG